MILPFTDLLHFPGRAIQRGLRELLERTGISLESPVHAYEERPLLYFIRGTAVSEGLAFHLFHREVFYPLIEWVTGAEVVDVRLGKNGLSGAALEVEAALAFIQEHHAREPNRHRPTLVGGWSRGALVAAEAAMRFYWVLGVIQIAPPTHGSQLSWSWIPGTLGDYGPNHPATLDYCARLEQWAQSPHAVPMLVVWSENDLLIRPPAAARVEHDNALDVPVAGLLWNHGTLGLSPRVMIELLRFIKDRVAEEVDSRAKLDASLKALVPA